MLMKVFLSGSPDAPAWEGQWPSAPQRSDYVVFGDVKGVVEFVSHYVADKPPFVRVVVRRTS